MGIRGQYKNKRDANEPEIFTELRAYGLSVHPMDTPADALVGWLGRSYLVEVKQPKGKLTGPQEAFLETGRAISPSCARSKRRRSLRGFCGQDQLLTSRL
jgi:hypothetical protein